MDLPSMLLPRGDESALRVEELDSRKQHTIDYVNKIQARFQNEKHVFKAFLHILNMYGKGNKTISDVYQEVALLLANHSDLLEEFVYFLPRRNGSTTISTPDPGQQPQREHDMKVKHLSDRQVLVREKSYVGEGSRCRQHVERAHKDGEEGLRDRNNHGFAEHKPPRVSNVNNATSTQSGRVLRFPAPASETTTVALMHRLENCLHKCERCGHEEYPIFHWVEARESASYKERAKVSLSKERSLHSIFNGKLWNLHFQL